jgi:hypothetical protein
VDSSLRNTLHIHVQDYSKSLLRETLRLDPQWPPLVGGFGAGLAGAAGCVACGTSLFFCVVCGT